MAGSAVPPKSGKGRGALGDTVIFSAPWRARGDREGPENRHLPWAHVICPTCGQWPYVWVSGSGSDPPLRLADAVKGPASVVSSNRVLNGPLARSHVGPVSLPKKQCV